MASARRSRSPRASRSRAASTGSWWSIPYPSTWRSSNSPSTAEISVAGTICTPCSAPAASASSIPSTVSWSVRASISTPASAAAATTCSAGSSPSEWMEWDWRSNAAVLTAVKISGPRAVTRVSRLEQARE